MCRALRVMCAARGRDALRGLQRSVVSAEHELVGGVAEERELLDAVRERVPDVLVLDAAFSGAIPAVRQARAGLKVVVVGRAVAGADAVAGSPAEARAAVLGLPRRPGSVR